MSRFGLRELTFALALSALSSCTCTQDKAKDLRFACTNNGDCIDGFVCRGGECRPTNQPPGACLPTDLPKICTTANTSTCQQSCQSDGGLGPCLPITGGPFES